MQQSGRTYIAIDLKSYYASVECMERGLDPMTTNLVVADLSRTEKTICLAVSPSLKAYGISGRARLFEVVERVKEVNAERRRKAGGNLFEKSCDAHELAVDPSRAVGYLVAPPQMAKYIQISTQIYNVYLKYITPEDIHVYSIDEVFMYVTDYLATYKLSPHDLAMKIMADEVKKNKMHIDMRTPEQKENGAPEVVVRIEDFRAGSVLLRAFVWTKDTISGGQALADIRYAVKEEFDKNNITIVN